MMVSTIRLYVDATYAVLVMAVAGVIAGSIAAVVTTDTQRSLQAALATFVLAGVLLTVRLWRVTRRRQEADTEAGNRH